LIESAKNKKQKAEKRVKPVENVSFCCVILKNDEDSEDEKKKPRTGPDKPASQSVNPLRRSRRNLAGAL
jgi:hypothetical protein